MSNKKKSEQLGMSYGTAANRLRKIMNDYICFGCYRAFIDFAEFDKRCRFCDTTFVKMPFTDVPVYLNLPPRRKVAWLQYFSKGDPRGRDEG